MSARQPDFSAPLLHHATASPPEITNVTPFKCMAYARVQAITMTVMLEEACLGCQVDALLEELFPG